MKLALRTLVEELNQISIWFNEKRPYTTLHNTPQIGDGHVKMVKHCHETERDVRG